MISAVVVTHSGGALVRACVESLHAQVRPPDAILVVVSNDRPVDTPPGAPVLHLGKNRGYAAAANAGAAATEGDVLLLNDDTVLAPDCVEQLGDAASGPGVYQPRILLACGSGRLDNAGHGFLPDGSVWALGRNGPADADLGEPGGFSGAAALIARSTWNALGGFDERLGNFFEDVDFSLRLLRRGHHVRAVPTAKVWHHLGATWGRTHPEKLRLLERNRLRAAVRSLPLPALAALPFTTAARYALFAALATMGRGPGEGVGPEARLAALRGLAEGLADCPAAWRDRARDRAHWALDDRQMMRALWAGRARWQDLIR